MERGAYASNVSDDEWAFVGPYSPLLRMDVLKWQFPRHELFHGLQWIIRTSSLWRWMTHDLLP
jgi:hypothetical protein